MIAMVDTRMGNLGSVRQAFARIGEPLRVAESPADLKGCDAAILPGVGAFGDGVRALEERGFAEAVRALALDERKPLLGICLGMQLMADEGEEHGHHKGLGLVPGRVIRLAPPEPGWRVPNIGWCDVAAHRRGVLFGEDRGRDSYYFAHSYHLACRDPGDVAATFEYGGLRIAAAIERGNLFGVQFHPEKSQDAGLDALAAFVRHVRGG